MYKQVLKLAALALVVTHTAQAQNGSIPLGWEVNGKLYVTQRDACIAQAQYAEASGGVPKAMQGDDTVICEYVRDGQKLTAQVFRIWGPAPPGANDPAPNSIEGKSCALHKKTDPDQLKAAVAQRIQDITIERNEAFAKNPALAVAAPGYHRFFSFGDGGGWREIGKNSEGGKKEVMKEPVFNIVYGRVVEALVAQAVKADACLSKYVVHQSDADQMQEGRNPDFVGIGRAKGLSIDVTTHEAMLRKRDQPGRAGWKFATYERLLKLVGGDAVRL